MSSGDFLARYGNGDLGDDVDYLKWASLLDGKAIKRADEVPRK